MSLATAGCRSSGAGVAAAPRQKVVVTKTRGTGAFAKVVIGDSTDKVRAAIGPPTTERGHLMGKNFNPFYWGGDRYRTIWYYAGKGRITFSIKRAVLIIEDDPSEDGKK